MIWVLDYQAEVTSDFSVFHGVTNVAVLPAQTFAPLARCLAAYHGAVQGALLAHLREQEESPAQDAVPPGLAGLSNIQFEPATGESFESRMARSVPAPPDIGQQLNRMMAGG